MFLFFILAFILSLLDLNFFIKSFGLLTELKCQPPLAIICGLNNNFLKCENLVNIGSSQNILHKEYKLVDLNDNLKKNLININDYVKFISNNQNIYIVIKQIRGRY